MIYQQADLETIKQMGNGQIPFDFGGGWGYKSGLVVESLKGKTSLFNFRGAVPYLIDALARLIIQDPKLVIDNPFDDFYRASVQWEYLAKLATNGDRENRRRFLRSVLEAYERPPDLSIDTGIWVRRDKNGNIVESCYKCVRVHPIVIMKMERIDRSLMSKRDAQLAKNLGEYKKDTKTGKKEGDSRIETRLGLLDIAFWKPIFCDCFKIADGGAKKGLGYIHTDAAPYSNFYTTWHEERNSDTFRRLYNPKKSKPADKPKKKDHIIFWRGVLYFLSTLSSNPKAETLTRKGDSLIDLLASVDPGQLNSKFYINNKDDVKVLIDQFCYLFNAMARRGFCEEMQAVPVFTTYKEGTEGLEVVIAYTRDTPRAGIRPYSSTYMEEVLLKNEPLGAVEYDEDE